VGPVVVFHKKAPPPFALPENDRSNSDTNSQTLLKTFESPEPTIVRTISNCSWRVHISTYVDATFGSSTATLS
jgi:hypothetical protein